MPEPAFSLHATLDDITEAAALIQRFEARHWQVGKSGWHAWELRKQGAELCLEASSPWLLHGDLESDDKKLIAELKKTNPFVEGNIFKSVENVNLSTVIAYKENGVKHHFLENFDV